jgi:hypothetical protein
MHFWPYRRWVLLVPLGLVCCSPDTTIVTNKAADYTKEPQKLFVVESLGPGLGGSSKSRAISTAASTPAWAMTRRCA